MKKELIKTPEYLLVVDDSEIKEGDYGFITSAVMSYDAMIKEWNQPLGSKIIAHLPLNNSPILEGVPLLPPLEEGLFVFPTKFEFEIVPKKEGTIMLIPPCKHCVKPKTTTNSQGQQVVCGKYIY